MLTTFKRSLVIIGISSIVIISLVSAKNPLQKQIFSFPSPGPSPEGLTWDGEFLWVVDSSTKLAYKLDSKNGNLVDSLTTLSLFLKEPKGLTWDGKYLWVTDNSKRNIYKFDVFKKVLVDSIKAPWPEGRGQASVQGLCWDGEYLWMAYFAGFSSKFNKIDTHDGSLVMSFFCDSHPRGLACDGKYLWSVCYNGKKLSSKIDRRQISNEPVEMFKSRVFLIDTPGKEPTGLAYDGKYLWIADKKERKIFRLEFSK